jgi:hypothetical protein
MRKARSPKRDDNGARLVSTNKVRITKEELRHLFANCIELLSLCERVSGKIDPAVGTMIAYARDELLNALPEESN